MKKSRIIRKKKKSQNRKKKKKATYYLLMSETSCRCSSVDETLNMPMRQMDFEFIDSFVKFIVVHERERGEWTMVCSRARGFRN
jgi:hypothetical protein